MFKYTFEIQHVADATTVRFTVTAPTQERAEKIAWSLNPTAKLVDFIKMAEDQPLTHTPW